VKQAVGGPLYGFANRTGLDEAGSWCMMLQKVAHTTSQVKNGVLKIDWDHLPGEHVFNPSPPAKTTPWGPEEATAAFKRVVAKFGPKDVLGVIPPNGKTADRLKDDRGKLPGYFNLNSPDIDANGGTWVGRSNTTVS
jgi:hypothetical protein